MNTEVTAEHAIDASPRTKARLTGVIYLLYFLMAIVGQIFLNGLVVSGDAAATATNIQAREPSFRVGIADGLIAIALYIAVTTRLYALFAPVNRNLSLLAAFFSLVGCAIQVVGSLFQLAALVVLGDGQSLSAFTLDQRQSLALVFLQLDTQALSIGLVFFGLYCLLIGYLIIRSIFLPRILGALMALAGLGWLTFLDPPLAQTLSIYVQVLGVIAEVALMLWLLILGVDERRWMEQSSTTVSLSA
jgi:Domain of unknown function (DUF4386)